jgi:hypothetical protein
MARYLGRYETGITAMPGDIFLLLFSPLDSLALPNSGRASQSSLASSTLNLLAVI